MFSFSRLKLIAIAIVTFLGITFFTTTQARATQGIEIEYRSFSGVTTLGPPADKYAADLAEISEQMLGHNEKINFKKISPRPKIPNGNIVSAVASGGKLVNGEGFDAAYISGGSLNPTWGFIYNSGIPVSGVSFERFIGFLYGNNSEESGLNLLQKTLDRRDRNIVAIPIVGGPAQGSGYFPKPVGNTYQEPGIGLRGLCQEPWTFRYLPPAENVLDKACDLLVGSAKQIDFIKAVPGGKILEQVNSNQIQAFEFVTPKDDFNLFFKNKNPNPGDLGLKYLHYPSWHQPYLITYLIVNKKVWEMLSIEQQDLIMTTARANVTRSYAENVSGQGYALQQILDINKNDGKSDNDIELVRWPDRDLDILRSASQEFIRLRSLDRNFSAADREDYQSILSAYQNYLEGDRYYWQKFSSME